MRKSKIGEIKARKNRRFHQVNELIKVNYEREQPTVSARDLHRELEVKYDFSRWVNSNFKDFTENEDFFAGHMDVMGNQYGGIQTIDDYDLTVDMAKHICLMSKTAKGKECRQYLIDLEKAWNTPEQVMARALKMADKAIDSLKKKIEEQRPLVDFAVHVSQTKDTIDMEEMAKIARDENIDIGRNRLIKWLKQKKVLTDGNVPYQEYINRGYFDVVEVKKETTYGTRVFPKTVVTGKGQIWVVEKLRAEYGR